MEVCGSWWKMEELVVEVKGKKEIRKRKRKWKMKIFSWKRK